MGVSIGIDTDELDDLIARLQGFPKDFQKSGEIVDAMMAEDLLRSIREYAPKRTGAYAASWSKQYMGWWRISTKAPNARRLEYGFFGVDSLGRNYKQPAQPHVKVAVEDISDRYTAAYRKLIKETWRSSR